VREMEYGLLSAEELEERRIFEEWEKRKSSFLKGGVRVKYVTWDGKEGEGWLVDGKIYKLGGKDITPEVKKWKEV